MATNTRPEPTILDDQFTPDRARGYPHGHFAVDRAGIEVGQRIDSEVTPIAWPRPADDLPPRPHSRIRVPARIVNPGIAPKDE